MAKPKRRATEDERARVRRLVGFGVPQDVICKMLGMTKRVFCREFREECADGKSVVIERVASKLYTEALKGNVPCMIFLLKCRGGDAWRERGEQAPSSLAKTDPTAGDVTIVRRRADGTLSEVTFRAGGVRCDADADAGAVPAGSALADQGVDRRAGLGKDPLGSGSAG